MGEVVFFSSHSNMSWDGAKKIVYCNFTRHMQAQREKRERESVQPAAAGVAGPQGRSSLGARPTGAQPPAPQSGHGAGTPAHARA